MIARGMSTRGKQIAALVALGAALWLPKRVECGYPGAAGQCARSGPFHLVCRRVELEPVGLYLIELIAERDVGFAYSVTEECR
jgi:hypothetical protein